jgi:voltage-gated potassium channel
LNSFKNRIYHIVFEADTTSGKLFDIVLIFAIIASVIVVMLDSVADLRIKYGDLFTTLEIGFTILFTLEYIARIYISEHKLKYIFSFFGIVDFLSIFPTYFGLFFNVKSSALITIRTLRLLRVFRVLKLIGFVTEAGELKKALNASKKKILVFLLAVLSMVTVMGTLMYMIESAESGFTSIPRSIYWAIVTLTTVGYGDIAPSSNLGQFLASIIMIMGYAIIAVPTGIVSTEMKTLKENERNKVRLVKCANCQTKTSEINARYCFHCGEKL